MNGNMPLEIPFEKLNQLPSGLYLDIRDPLAYQAGHHPWFQNAPLDKISVWSQKLNPRIPIYLVCSHGETAKDIAISLRQKGYLAFSMIGGMYQYTMKFNPLYY